MSPRNALETLSEDTVYCFFFPTLSSAGGLEELCKSINKTIQNLSAEYIWHRDEFRVYIPINKENNELPARLVSVTCFGDNIEDEWFIVYLLLQISGLYPNLVIQVYDNDGEFILIEASDFLPSWANPDTTENRVFIYQNHIHLLLPKIADMDTNIELHDAIKLTVDHPEQTKCPEIQQAILKRIGDYPQKIYDNIHRAIVKLPVHIAALVSLKPSLISPIVSAYCSHDVIDAKACKNVDLKDCVTTQIKFTKCLYAMLVHSKLIRTVKQININEADKISALGFKLTCGYEMIMSKLTGDIFSSREFNCFLKSLTDNGYFKENMEGSRDYKILLNEAKEFFLAMECPINTQVSNNISQLMQTKGYSDLLELKKLNPPDEIISEDSDDWLNIHPEQLNDLLNMHYGKQTKYKSGDVIDSQIITSELSDFLKQTSDYEGIDTKKEKDDEDIIHFDSEEFVDSIKKYMNFMTSENNVDNLDSDFSDDMDDTSFDDMVDVDGLDKELREKLNTNEKINSQNQSVLVNMVKSMKEEQGSSGPTSNILRTIGINKTDILDSDDDEIH